MSQDCACEDEIDFEAVIGSILDHVETLVTSEKAARITLTMAARSICESEEEWQELVSLVNQAAAAELKD